MDEDSIFNSILVNVTHDCVPYFVMIFFFVMLAVSAYYSTKNVNQLYNAAAAENQGNNNNECHKNTVVWKNVIIVFQWFVFSLSLIVAAFLFVMYARNSYNAYDKNESFVINNEYRGYFFFVGIPFNNIIAGIVCLLFFILMLVAATSYQKQMKSNNDTVSVLQEEIGSSSSYVSYTTEYINYMNENTISCDGSTVADNASLFGGMIFTYGITGVFSIPLIVIILVLCIVLITFVKNKITSNY